MQKFSKVARFILVLSLFSAFISGCQPGEKTPLVVFAAGSLIGPFGELEKAFEAKYPNIDVIPEYHGSIQVIRHATDLHQKIDVIATADHALIPMLMYKAIDPDTNVPYADWYIKFATNRLALAYTDTSKFADEITTENWMEVLGREDVKVGIADPRFDPSGYRALMAIKLAEDLFQKPYLFSDMFAGQFRIPIKVEETGDFAVLEIPEVLESRSGAHVVVRGASIQLLALLESGDLDYAFEYESVIKQHGLNMLSLQPELNLGEEAYNPNYEKVTVKLDFQRFSVVKPEFIGEQIGYGITIPSNAPHQKEAELFIAFLLSPDGRQVMQDSYHPLFDTVLADGMAHLPVNLNQYVSPLHEE